MAKKALIVSFSFEQEPEAFEALRERGVEPILLAESERKGWGQQEPVSYTHLDVYKRQVKEEQK